MKEQFRGKLLRICFTEADQFEGRPLYEAIVTRCRELEMAGATVYRGQEGFGASARIHHARSLSISRNAPIMVSIVDTDDRIQQLLPHLDKMLPGGLVAVSTVDIIRYSQPKQDEPNAG